MHGTLSSYIQINVYGRKLQEIERSGIDMTKLLNKIGCEKFWIGEVPLYNLVEFSASDSSLVDDYGGKEAVETDAPPDLFRNSLADIKFPPCSTPIYSKRYPSFKIPPGISVIKSMENFENNADLSSNESGGVCIKDCVLDVLQNLLQKVELAISHDDAVLRADTISNSSSKRAINNVKRRTCTRIEDLPTTLSKQQKTIENSPTTNSEDFVSHRKIKMEVGITKEVASNPLLTTNLPNLLTDRLESPNVSKQRSERIFSELNPVIHYIDSEKTNLYHTADNLFENQPEHSKWETFEERLYESPDYYDYDCSMTHEEGHVGRDQEDTVLLENCEGVETEKIIDNAEHLENNVVMNDVADVYGKVNEESSLRHSPASAKKKVSFAKPLIRNSNKTNMHDLHIIKCHFNGCNKSYSWRRKYGKLRLVDHAFTHVPHLELKCSLCDHTCKGLRLIRYHHKRNHPNTELNGFGMKRVLDGSNKANNFQKIWNDCYGKNPVFFHSNETIPFKPRGKEGNEGINIGNRLKISNAEEETIGNDQQFQIR